VYCIRIIRIKGRIYEGNPYSRPDRFAEPIESRLSRCAISASSKVPPAIRENLSPLFPRAGIPRILLILQPPVRFSSRSTCRPATPANSAASGDATWNSWNGGARIPELGNSRGSFRRANNDLPLMSRQSSLLSRFPDGPTENVFLPVFLAHVRRILRVL